MSHLLIGFCTYSLFTLGVQGFHVSLVSTSWVGAGILWICKKVFVTIIGEGIPRSIFFATLQSQPSAIIESVHNYYVRVKASKSILKHLKHLKTLLVNNRFLNRGRHESLSLIEVTVCLKIVRGQSRWMKSISRCWFLPFPQVGA